MSGYHAINNYLCREETWSLAVRLNVNVFVTVQYVIAFSSNLNSIFANSVCDDVVYFAVLRNLNFSLSVSNVNSCCFAAVYLFDIGTIFVYA